MFQALKNFFKTAEKVSGIRYFFCSFKYFLRAPFVGSTNTGMGTIVIQGKKPNPVDTIMQIKSLHPEYEIVIPVLFHEIDESMYNDYLTMVAK